MSIECTIWRLNEVWNWHREEMYLYKKKNFQHFSSLSTALIISSYSGQIPPSFEKQVEDIWRLLPSSSYPSGYKFTSSIRHYFVFCIFMFCIYCAMH